MLTHAHLAQIVMASYSLSPSVSSAFDVRAVFHQFEDEMVVAITGTVSVPGWLRDFEFWPHNDVALGRCHSGFLASGKELWALVKAEAARAVASGRRVTYAGHSLGGAEAQICAAEHVAYGLAAPRIVTFGAPRVALWVNRLFRGMLRDVDATLYKRAGDPVPHVPLMLWFGHIRPNVIIGSILLGSRPTWPLDPVNDRNHGIAQYVSDLCEAARQ